MSHAHASSENPDYSETTRLFKEQLANQYSYPVRNPGWIMALSYTLKQENCLKGAMYA
jgi:hypothetical protein